MELLIIFFTIGLFQFLSYFVFLWFNPKLIKFILPITLGLSFLISAINTISRTYFYEPVMAKCAHANPIPLNFFFTFVGYYLVIHLIFLFCSWVYNKLII